MLQPNHPIPSFSLPDQHGNIRTNQEFKGKWLVIYFYPKDNTPGCTQEACSFRDSLDGFRKKNIEVIGISKDVVASHAKFAKKFDLSFPLLADPELGTIKAFGVWGRKTFMGIRYDGIFRTTFLIDPKGIIKKVYENVHPADHASVILRDYESLAL